MEHVKRRRASEAQFASVLHKLKEEKYFQKLEDTPNLFIDTRVRCPLCGNTVYLEVQKRVCFVQCNTPLCMKKAIKNA